MLENLKGVHSGEDRKGSLRPYVRLTICFGLAGVGYLLFLIGDGFPPYVWRLLFNVLPQLQSLWAAKGSSILLPLIGLCLLSVSLLILWGVVVIGIIHSLVHLWPASHQQERLQTDLDESTLILEQQTQQTFQTQDVQQPSQTKQTQQPSQPQQRLPSTDTMELGFMQQDSSSEPTLDTQPLPAQQPSRLMLPSRQFQLPFSQQIQPLRDAVPAYVAAPQSTGPHMRHKGSPYARLHLIPQQAEPEQNFSEDLKGLGQAQPLRKENATEDLEELDTRPRDVSETLTRPTHTAWNEEGEDEQEATLRLVTGIGLDPGLVRRNRPNEDSLFAIQGFRSTPKDGPVPAGLFVIADGMGGHANGGDASRLAVREISARIVPTLLHDQRDEAGARHSGSEIPSLDEHDEQEFLLNLLKDGVDRANRAIHQRNQTMPNMMGTTITAALVVDTTAYVINVGDSRTYLYRAADGLVPITRDHSIVAHLVEEGEIQPDEIYTHPIRNQIYRCLGQHPTVELDTFVVPLQPDDILLLCSDGLWEMVRDPAMKEIITSSAHLPAQISDTLVQAALDEGGADNISVVVVGIAKTV
jgi:serine/threonine protein phosphatase PrpC